MSFKVGDVVRMKSGGPMMTVIKIRDGGELECAWFNQNGHEFKHESYYFQPETLKPVNV